jgi:hypothetical protein
VPQIVRGDSRYARCLDRLGEPSRLRMRTAQVLAVVAGEQQIVAAETLDSPKLR